MSTPESYSYDVFPYESHPFAQTHPDRLATVATVLGLRPPPVTKCRVLELGCSSGGNLIPMALTLPHSTFLGVDLSRREIEEGQDQLRKLGLGNIELKHISVEGITDETGRFDYILCHGVYSWVPNAVQDKILDVCLRNLAPDGIAYVSYNTYPGWHMRGMIRDMMQYHTKHFTDPAVRVKQARNLLDFLARALEKEKSPYSLNLRAELELIRHCRDSYLFHEHLEDCNDPIYFHQFADRAAAKGLRYLGESDFAVMVPGNYPPEISNVLHMLSVSLTHMEQYMDFLRNRTFRQTLLCHQAQTPNYKLNPDTLKSLYVSSPAKPLKEEPDIHSDESEQFRAPDGAILSSRKPVMKAAMLHLSKVWPRSVPFEALRKQAQALLHLEPDATAVERDSLTLSNGLLTTYASLAAHIVELHTFPCPYTTEVGDRPRASPLAHLQAEAGSRVTNLRHEEVNLEGEFDRQLLRLLDGTRDRSEILRGLAMSVAAGELVIYFDCGPCLMGAK